MRAPDTTTPTRPQRIASSLAMAGLGGAAVLHAAWARGSSWPAADREQLTDAVVGRRASREAGGFPDAQASLAVAGLLTAAAGLTAARVGWLPFPGGRSAWPVRVGTRVVATVMLSRGVGGLVVSGLDLAPTTPACRRWNLRLYSPVCLVIGTSVAVVSRSSTT